MKTLLLFAALLYVSIAIDTTHIANGCPFQIWAMVDADRVYVTKASQSFKGEASGPLESSVGVDSSVNIERQIYHIADSNGFTKILPNRYLGFQPFGVNVYITIYYQKSDTPHLYQICEAYPLRSDYSVVIDSHCTIQRTEYGYTWKDTAGHDHFGVKPISTEAPAVHLTRVRASVHHDSTETSPTAIGTGIGIFLVILLCVCACICCYLRCCFDILNMEQLTMSNPFRSCQLIS